MLFVVYLLAFSKMVNWFFLWPGNLPAMRLPFEAEVSFLNKHYAVLS